MTTNPWFNRPSQPPAAAPDADAVLLAYARGRLAAGRRPEQAFLDIVELGADRRLAAIVVCAAAGTPWSEALSRMVAFDDVWASLGSGSAETAGSLLELYGYFDVEVALDGDQAEIAAFLRQAMSAVAYLPSGYANGLYRMLRTGRLRDALLSLEEMGAQRWADNREFWAGLLQAAIRLDSVSILDTEVAAARRRCEARSQA